MCVCVRTKKECFSLSTEGKGGPEWKKPQQLITPATKLLPSLPRKETTAIIAASEAAAQCNGPTSLIASSVPIFLA